MLQRRWVAVVYLWFATAAFVYLAIVQERTDLKIGWSVWAVAAVAGSIWSLLRAPTDD